MTLPLLLIELLGQTAGDTFYATTDELNDRLGEDLTSAEASAVIAFAEDLVDERLGNRPVNETSGRKVTEADVLPWQWTKIKRATLAIAADLFKNPQSYQATGAKRIKGPDYEIEHDRDTAGKRLPADAVAAINSSRLVWAWARVR